MGWMLAFGAVCGVLCAFIADANGRSMAGWAIAGFLFPLSVLILLAIGKPKAETE